MTRIYLVRHCEAMGNLKRVFQGITNLDISENGEKQLEFLCERFKDVPLDKIYTSPLLRTRKTALAIKGEKDTVIEEEPGLIEQNVGVFENLPFKDTFDLNPKVKDIWNNYPQDWAPEKGEKMKDVYDRIWETVCRIAKQNMGKTVACATHGGVLRCLICRLTKGDIAQLKNVQWCDNTAVSLIEFDDDFNVNIKYYNDASHLPKEYLPSNSRPSVIFAE